MLKGLHFPHHLLNRGQGHVDENNFKFQALQWTAVDEGPWPKPNLYQTDQRQYTVYINGVSEQGHAVTLKTAYNPFFLVKVPDDTNIHTFVRKNLTHTDQLMSYQEKKNRGLEYEDRAIFKERYFDKWAYGGKKAHLNVKASLAHYRELNWRDDIHSGFTGLVPKRFKFIYLEFHTLDMLRLAVNHLRSNKYEIYEANLEPHLRLAHLTNVQMAGWLTVDRKKCNFNYKPATKWSNSNIEIELDKWSAMRGIDNAAVAPIRHCSFDLECHSDNPTQFPDPKNPKDVILQCALHFSDEGRPNSKVSILLNLGPCDKLDDDQILIVCDTEKELLEWFALLIERADPDIVHAYNAYGFDMEYLHVRAKLNGCENLFKKNLGKLKKSISRLMEKKLKSNAYGANYWRILTMPGRFVMDTLVYMKKEHKLPKYSLNYVAKKFLSTKLKKNPLSYVPGESKITVAHEKHGFKVGDVINLSNVTTPDLERKNGKSFYTCGGWTFEQLHGRLHTIVEVVSDDAYVIEMSTPSNATREEQETLSVGGGNVQVFESKHDISFKDMNLAYKARNGEIMSKVGKYCIQDTILPQKILDRLCVVTNLIEMSKVTWVPLDYLITRGQQVKVFSQISLEAYHDEIAVPAYKRRDDGPDSTGYEGGAVLEPDVGFYTKPIAVPDFKSLYPSEICDHRLCYCNHVKDPKYMNLPGVRYLYVKIDETTTHVFATNNEGLVPRINAKLLDARIVEKGKMARAKTEMEKKIHNGAQLALKVSANSIYGFTGVDPKIALLPCKAIAESTTYLGRKATYFTRDYAENADNFKDIMQCKQYFPDDYIVLVKDGNRTKLLTLKELQAKSEGVKVYAWGDYQEITGFEHRDDGKVRVLLASGDDIFDMSRYSCKVVYGDTDSVFTMFDTDHLENPRDRVVYSMMVAAYISAKITHEIRIANPHVPYDEQRMELEYEKVYVRFILYSKKRYDGFMVEMDPDRGHDDNKGNPKKRRDFCPFTQENYGKIIDELFDLEEFNHQTLVKRGLGVATRAVEDLINDRVPMEKLIISRSLNDEYKIREKNESSLKRKRTFGPGNIFENDMVRVKRDKKNTWKVVKKGVVDPTTLRGSLELQEVIEDEQQRPPTLQTKTINYDNIAQRLGKIITLLEIMDPQTPEIKLEPVKQSHVWLSRKMSLRDPANAPSSGSRLDFVYCKTQDTNALQRERAEDPKYALEHGLECDPLYYLNKQCRRSWSLVLDTVVPGISAKIFDDAIARYNMKLSGQQALRLSTSGEFILEKEDEIVVNGKRKELKTSQRGNRGRARKKPKKADPANLKADFFNMFKNHTFKK